MRKFWRTLTRLHKWAGLILGIQITLWFASGFFMTLFPIDQVRGRHVAKAPISAVDAARVDVNAVLTTHEGEVSELRIRDVAGRMIVSLGEDHYAADGAKLGVIDEALARESARLAYVGEGQITEARLLETAPGDYRGPLPVWQVRFDDRARTRLYLDPVTAEMRSVRTRLWRVFDTMWMLHIMDYTERSNFNTWWLRLLSGAALLFALSGLALVTHRVFLRPRRERAEP